MKSSAVELWIAIPSLPGYEASNFGNIRSFRWTVNRNHSAYAQIAQLKKIFVNENGYCIVGIGHSKRMRVHVLVAEAFLGPKPGKLDVNHKDGNKQNNRPENLEYITRSDNCRHGFELGLSFTSFREYQGSKHPLSKLEDSDVRAIREDYSNGISRRDLATKYGISYYTVWDITERRRWTHI